MLGKGNKEEKARSSLRRNLEVGSGERVRACVVTFFS